MLWSLASGTTRTYLAGINAKEAEEALKMGIGNQAEKNEFFTEYLKAQSHWQKANHRKATALQLDFLANATGEAIRNSLILRILGLAVIAVVIHMSGTDLNEQLWLKYLGEALVADQLVTIAIDTYRINKAAKQLQANIEKPKK